MAAVEPAELVRNLNERYRIQTILLHLITELVKGAKEAAEQRQAAAHIKIIKEMMGEILNLEPSLKHTGSKGAEEQKPYLHRVQVVRAVLLKMEEILRRL